MKQTKKSILFTGGGSAGHVTPNIALIELLKKAGWEISYAGSTNGIEKELISSLNIPYYPISTGKLRRYFSWQTFLTPFYVLKGIYEAFQLCRKIKPNLVFSKGGFVSVPIIIGAWLNKIPVIAHESDLTPGLANRIAYPFVKKIAFSFPQTQQYFKNQNKLVYTGTPIRNELLKGDAFLGKKFLNFPEDKPLLLIYGGGLGSTAINKAIRNILPELTKEFNVVHCCGKNKIDSDFTGYAGYKQFEYLHEELAHVMAAAHIIISRAGANSIYELLALKKPHLLIPLSKKASRGDQIDNAKYFEHLGLSLVLQEEDLTKENLLKQIHYLLNKHHHFHEALMKYSVPDSLKLLIKLID